MTVLAIIDATGVEAPDGPATIVAGLSLLERTVRLAAVCGADDILVVPARSEADRCRRLIDDTDVDVPVQLWTGADTELADSHPDIVAIFDAGAVIERSLVNAAIDDVADAPAGTIRRIASPHLAVLKTDASTNPQQLLEQPGKSLRDAPARISGGWAERIDSRQAVKRAERRLWNGCRKPQDGIISRHLNRHISLSISRLLAPTSVDPNHVTAITFLLGIAAAAAAVFGTFWGFVAAGILYQLNSVIDGVDGELARVRYEFSVTGEWLDTVSDDMADLLMYLGVGIGAWRTLTDAPGPMGAELWLILGIVAAVAKLASMVVYYRWLIAHGRGDLLAFQWSFEDDDGDDEPKSRLAELLSFTRYFFRKDFIVFIAMICSFGGVLPHLLFALAPGNAIVAVSVLLQQHRHRQHLD